MMIWLTYLWRPTWTGGLKGLSLLSRTRAPAAPVLWLLQVLQSASCPPTSPPTDRCSLCPQRRECEAAERLLAARVARGVPLPPEESESLRASLASLVLALSAL